MRTLRRGAVAAIALTCAFTLAACGSAEEPGGSEASDDMTSESPMDDMSESPMDDDMSESPMEDDMAEDEMMSDALDFTATTVSGDTFEGADLAGSPAVVFFWSEMCDTCADTAAALADVEGVELLSVAGKDSDPMDDPMADVSGVTQLEDGMGDLASHFGVMADGDVVLIDDHGEVTHQGPMDPMKVPDEVASLTM
ncbi:redoxin domain-containing protein [Promicromonospora iranensis]|jgi:peroxiredoxin|uniref:redoxin domain-containing protein n=1 Tax=Promicromonospora iranensis TaxID=1105144 RepID=UPI0023A91C52|nr:redoxin domain-containing protein [Promicromonospora iranensis]